jgi:soluble cytochrome b562
MKRGAAIAVVFISALAGATSISDYEKMPSSQRDDVVVNFIDKMTTDIRAKNPDLAVKIRNWFAVKAEGRELPEGFERLLVELGALDLAAKDGKADLAKIQIESVIVYLVKQKFITASQAKRY